MISSAGSPLKSKVRMAWQTSSVSGHVSIRASVRINSGYSRSISIRPNSDSLLISQMTIAEIPTRRLKGAKPRGASGHRSRRRAKCGYQDPASHLTPVDSIFPLILIFPLKLPISLAESVWIGMSLATGFPCFVIIMPSGLTRSSRAKHYSLNLAAGIVFMQLE